MSTPGQGRHRDGLRWVHAIGVALAMLFVLGFVVRNHRLQWDFRTYLAAAQCALRGLDPYLLENLRAVSGRPIELPFIYLPAALVTFLPFAALPNADALWAWIGLKCAVSVGLVMIWKRVFLPEVPWLALMLAAVFGFNGALLWDLRSGNVALLEVALLWLGFATYVAHRRAWFGALVVAASIYKLLPIAFLALLLVPAKGRRWPLRLLVICLLAFASITVGPTLVPPASRWSGFSPHMASAFPAGDANPGFLALIWALASAAGVVEPWRLALSAWGVYALAVTALSVPWFLGVWRRRDAQDLVMGAALIYVLLSPRPMAYGYLLAIPPALHFTRSLPGGTTAALLVALVISAQGLARVANYPLQGLAAHHLPFLIVLTLWLAVAGGALRGPARNPENPVTP